MGALPRPNGDVNWNEVIAKTLALLALRQSDENDGTMLEQLAFLSRLGLPKAECANLLNTSVASLAEQERQARLRKERGKNGKKDLRRAGKR